MAPILTHRLWYSMAEATDAAVLGNLPDGTLRLIAWLLGLLGSRRRPRTLSATDLAVVNQSLEGCLGKYCNLLMNNRPLLCKFLIIFVPWRDLVSNDHALGAGICSLSILSESWTA